jgi:hypothetical protein
LDFATFSFHDPTAGSVCAKAGRVLPLIAQSPPSNTTEITVERWMRVMLSLPCVYTSYKHKSHHRGGAAATNRAVLTAGTGYGR